MSTKVFFCAIVVLHLPLVCNSFGLFNLTGVKDSILSLKKVQPDCSANTNRLLYLLNIVCSTAQPTNVTLRDACYACFYQITTLPSGASQINLLSVCASQYYANTAYATCGTSLIMTVTNGLSAQMANGQCFTGYCQFVRCLRRINSNNLIVQCTRESRTGVNITSDADNLRFFVNVTSCVLARARCSAYNPITGEPQIPGATTQYGIKGATQVAIYNSLQVSTAGDIRVVSFPASVIVQQYYCAADNSLTQSTFTNSIC